MERILKNKWLYAAIGAIGGLLYWKFIGCASGSCPIQQNWYLSTAWGATLGWLISGVFLGCGCNGESCNMTDQSNSKTKNKEEEK